MAYKASYSASMAAPMNQQAYYSSYGYDQSYGMQDYEQTYEDYNYDYSMAEAEVPPEVHVMIKPPEEIRSNTMLEHPIVMSLANPEQAHYIFSAVVKDASGSMYNFFNYEGQTWADLAQMDAQQTMDSRDKSLYAIMPRMKMNVAGKFRIELRLSRDFRTVWEEFHDIRVLSDKKKPKALSSREAEKAKQEKEQAQELLNRLSAKGINPPSSG